jgi:hypothetical protein
MAGFWLCESCSERLGLGRVAAIGHGSIERHLSASEQLAIQGNPSPLVAEQVVRILVWNDYFVACLIVVG